MPNRWSVLAMLAMLSAPVAPAMAAQEITERNYEYCTVCHGANGNGNAAIHAPRIAGLEPWYLKNQFTAFKAGWRGAHPDDAPGNEMRPVAQLLSTAEIEQAIAFVATWQPKIPANTVGGDAAHGKALYQSCSACHGANGQGNQSLHAPALAQRTDWYLVTQLRNYRAGLRGSNRADVNGQQMRAMAVTLPNDAAIDDVVAYIDSLR